jgi:prepilin-type N-terminal cleavage/methylation domain-containing protein
MDANDMNKKKGFTLVELLIALAVGMLLMAAVYGVVNMGQKSSTGIERRVISQKDVRGALDLMALELRMASYNPGLDNTVWRSTDCASASVNPLYKGIQAATASSITIEMDANDNTYLPDGTAASSAANPSEIITYNYETANNRITRSTNCGAAQPFIGATILRIVNNAAGVPVFRYFDFNNNEIAAANLPAQIPMIRAIEISLVADLEYDNDPISKQPRRIIYSIRVIPRNHGANP